ncbi:MAG: hypothetical protein K6E21_02100, partial [Bacilli bacterium]|nr:hypothetical protein [Bacilli bacterium]
MKKKLLCLTLFSLFLCGCNEKPSIKPNEENQIISDNNGESSGDNGTSTLEQFYELTLKEYDSEKNIYWTNRDNIGYMVSSFLIENTSPDLDEYFGYPLKSVAGGIMTKPVSIKSDNEYNVLKTKMSTLESQGKILEKYLEQYPVVDFSTYKIELTLLYKNQCRCDFALYSLNLYPNRHVIEQFINGNNSSTTLTGDVGVGLCYVILPKDSVFTVQTAVTYVDYNDTDTFVVKKPIVYFYPEKEIDLTIKFTDEERLITTYPKYNGGWNIHLKENGTFTANDSDREYYALYFDEVPNYSCEFKEGFYVTKDNAISFLEEKMDYMGFNNHEVNEFIMY